MLPITPLYSIIFGLLFLSGYYLLVSAYTGKLVKVEPLKLLFYITLFSLFGISGEIVVNITWEQIFGWPLWEYRLFPLHHQHISYFFPLIWGMLGVYKYINDTALHTKASQSYIKGGLIMGVEAILLEIAYNGLFLLLFNEYIFYYLPANMGPLSHLSCWQVIPFYFMVGLVTSKLIQNQNTIGYNRSLYSRIAFYWMVITALLLL